MWVRQNREARGWEQKELARRAGISPAYLSNLENAARHTTTGNVKIPSPAKVAAIAQAFGYTPDLAYRSSGRWLMIQVKSTTPSPAILPSLASLPPRAQSAVETFHKVVRADVIGSLLSNAEQILEEDSAHTERSLWMAVVVAIAAVETYLLGMYSEVVCSTGERLSAGDTSSPGLRHMNQYLAAARAYPQSVANEIATWADIRNAIVHSGKVKTRIEYEQVSQFLSDMRRFIAESSP